MQCSMFRFFTRGALGDVARTGGIARFISGQYSPQESSLLALWWFSSLSSSVKTFSLAWAFAILRSKLSYSSACWSSNFLLNIERSAKSSATFALSSAADILELLEACDLRDERDERDECDAPERCSRRWSNWSFMRCSPTVNHWTTWFLNSKLSLSFKLNATDDWYFSSAGLGAW